VAEEVEERRGRWKKMANKNYMGIWGGHTWVILAQFQLGISLRCTRNVLREGDKAQILIVPILEKWGLKVGCALGEG
jgi:hypothetical protein